MKAWVLHDIGDISFEEVEMPSVREDEVLVKVHNAGICGSDIPRVFDNGAHRMPLIIGHEFSGEVVQSGSDKYSKLLGARIGIFPLIPCRSCIACRKGLFEMCRNYSYLGSRQDGGFAEYAAVPAVNVIKLPENVSYEDAAMLEPSAVAVHAMRRVHIEENDSVVVCGLGTIGMLLTMILRARGIKKLFVIGNKDFQKDKAYIAGIPAENFCDSRKGNVKDWVMEKTSGAGADVFFECVGRNETIAEAVDIAAPGGRICYVGNPFGDVKYERDTYWKILRNQLVVTGTWNSGFFRCDNSPKEEITDWEYVLAMITEGKIRPREFISHRLPLENLSEGLDIMHEKKEDYLKVMINME